MINNEEKNWVIHINNTFYGPLSITEIKQAIYKKKFYCDSPIWKKGWSSWKKLSDIPILSYEAQRLEASPHNVQEDLPIPKIEDFLVKINPKVTNELGTITVWDGKRVAIMAGSTILAGIPGALIGGFFTRRKKKIKEELEDSKQYIDKKNQ